MDTAERSILRARAAYDKYYSSKKKKAIKIIKNNEVSSVRTESVSTCRAVIMNGNQCKNRAICNGLCKRHAIN